MGFPDDALEAIALMTHAEGVPYMDYVKRIKENPIARAVKLADLRHNSDETRFDEGARTERDLARAEKYAAAIVKSDADNKPVTL